MSKRRTTAAPDTPPCESAKFDRPVGSGGDVDWEHFFEHHQEGVIPLILEAESFDKLQKCSEVVVDSLFTRDNDAPKREAFGRILNNFLDCHSPGAQGKPPAEVKEGLAKILRYIKDDRKARAEAHAQVEARRAPDGEQGPFPLERREPDGLIALEEADAGDTPAGDEPSLHDDPHALFIAVFWDIIEERLAVLRSGVAGQRTATRPLPFMFSKAFAGHFGTVLRDNLLPLVADRSKGLVHQADLQPPGERRTFLMKAMNDEKNRRTLWETWKEVWKESTVPQPLPRKPKDTKKKGLAGKLLARKKETPAWKKEMTLEEWEAECRHIKRGNRRAEQLWATITEPSDAYQPPDEEHNDFLMELFGRSPKVMREQVAALRQIATQGGNASTAYDMYQKGKNLDLALLTACLWHPDAFLEGKRPMLKVFTAAYPKGSLPGFMPLLARYMASHLG